MGWKSAYLKRLVWRYLLLGAVAGAWAGFLSLAALLATGYAEWAWVRHYVPALVMGAVLGLLLAPADALLHRFPRRALRTAAAGLVLGAVGAFVGTWPMVQGWALRPLGRAAPLIDWQAPQLWLGVGLPLALVAAGAGLASGLGPGQLRRGLARAGYGLAGGAMASVPLAALYAATQATAWAYIPGLSAWAALAALAVFWPEKRRARRWIRVLVGSSGEDHLFPLAKPEVTLGKLESNDIPLRDAHEVYPYHCHLRWNTDHYDIIDDERGGIVLVNFREVQEQALRPGDLVKIGSVLLQYGEESRP